MEAGRSVQGILVPVPGNAAWAVGPDNSRVASWKLVGPSMTIGRSGACEIVIRDPSVSRRHADLVWVDDRLFVRHLSATNPTLVNGVPAPHGEAVELGNADKMQIGAAQFEIMLWNAGGDDLTKPQSPPRSLVAVLAADVVGYSALCRRDEAGTISRFLQCLRIFRRHAQLNRGRVLDTGEKGDCVYSLYQSVILAISAAFAIRAEVLELNRSIAADRRIDFRFGMHCGDVVFEGEGIRGDAINTAAHLQAEAEPGQIVVSARIQEQLAADARYGFEPFRPSHPKNANEPVAYRCVVAR